MREMRENLKKLRSDAGSTLEEVGAAAGVTAQAICQYELGVRFPSPVILSLLADYYGVSVDYILGRADKPYRAKGVGHGQ
jgi:transcriptional regulator with XRE-family HTH domain